MICLAASPGTAVLPMCSTVTVRFPRAGCNSRGQFRECIRPSGVVVLDQYRVLASQFRVRIGLRIHPESALLYDADAVVHWERCEAEGLQCPQEVFTQLFHPEHVGVTAAVTAERSSGPLVSDLKAVMAVDWGRVSWELAEFSGVALGTCGWNGNINMP
jgi:hypothetical protein